MSYTLPSLLYSYDSLEPYFDAKTMKIHYTKHHQTYVNNINDILQNTDYLNLSIEELVFKLNTINVKDKLKLQNNVGGHINHSLFWKFLKLNVKLENNFEKVIQKNFGSVECFKKMFQEISVNHFGSGWTWLIKNDDSSLKIVSTVNQNNPLMGKKLAGCFGYPILCLDLWEHSYYLKYKNNRISYINAFWNVINWNEVSNRFFNQ